MYIKKPETEKQWFKIFKILKENGEMTVSEIHAKSQIPIPSIRRTLSDFDATGKLEKRFVYKIKDKTDHMEGNNRHES